MVNRVGRVHKLDKYNSQKPVVTNRRLNTTLSNSNSHDKYNENIDLGRKKSTETYSRPSNDENYALYLFLAYFIHLVVGNNLIFEPLYPLHV